MTSKAYAVLLIDTTTGQAVGMGIFSEPHPTTRGPISTIPVYQHEAATFGEAADMAELILEDERYAFAGELRHCEHRGAYRVREEARSS